MLRYVEICCSVDRHVTALAASSDKHNITVLRPSVRLSLCLFRLFLSTLTQRVFLLTSIGHASHNQRDSPGVSTRRGQRTFPSEYHHAQYIKLMKKHIPVKVLNLIENMCSSCYSTVKWDNVWSDMFRVDFGVRHDSVLSPYLFASSPFFSPFLYLLSLPLFPPFLFLLHFPFPSFRLEVGPPLWLEGLGSAAAGPGGGPRGNVHGSSVALWKARGRLPISPNWTFLPALTVEALWANIGRNCVFWKGWVTLSANFRGTGGHPPTNFGVRKLEPLGYHVVLFAWSYV